MCLVDFRVLIYVLVSKLFRIRIHIFYFFVHLFYLCYLDNIAFSVQEVSLYFLDNVAFSVHLFYLCYPDDIGFSVQEVSLYFLDNYPSIPFCGSPAVTTMAELAVPRGNFIHRELFQLTPLGAL